MKLVPMYSGVGHDDENEGPGFVLTSDVLYHRVKGWDWDPYLGTRYVNTDPTTYRRDAQ